MQAMLEGLGGGDDVTLSISDGSVSEDAGSVNVDLTLSRAGSSAVTVTVFTRRAESTGTPGSDFYAMSEEVTFTVGETRKSITTIILDDYEVEGHKTMAVRLAGASGATIADDLAVVTIRDDDGAISSAVSIADQSGGQSPIPR